MGKYSGLKDNKTGSTTSQRSKAVKEAWDRERELVRQGKGTRDWTEQQQRDILAGETPKDENGKPIEGHHMLSVSGHEEHAANPDNIQFLTRDEHIQGAHNQSSRNQTNGRYDPATGETTPFADGTPKAPEPMSLSNPVVQQSEDAQQNTNEEQSKPSQDEEQNSRLKSLVDQEVQGQQEGAQNTQKGNSNTQDGQSEATENNETGIAEEVPSETPEEISSQTPAEFSTQASEEVSTGSQDQTDTGSESEDQQSDESEGQTGSQINEQSGEAVFVESCLENSSENLPFEDYDQGESAFVESGLENSSENMSMESGSQSEAAFAESSLSASEISGVDVSASQPSGESQGSDVGEDQSDAGGHDH